MSVSNNAKRVKEIRRKTRRKFSSEETGLSLTAVSGLASGFMKRSVVLNVSLDEWLRLEYATRIHVPA